MNRRSALKLLASVPLALPAIASALAEAALLPEAVIAEGVLDPSRFFLTATGKVVTAAEMNNALADDILFIEAEIHGPGNGLTRIQWVLR